MTYRADHIVYTFKKIINNSDCKYEHIDFSKFSKLEESGIELSRRKYAACNIADIVKLITL